MNPTAAVKEVAGQTLAAWALNQVRMRAIARRPWGIYDGRIQGETLFHDPAPLDEVPSA